MPVKAGTILDLATGTGLVAISAAQKVSNDGSVIGVDLSQGMLAQAREKIERLQLNNIELIEADVEAIAFPSEKFDLIFCCSAITYFSDVPNILNKCYEWLKPKDSIAFTTPYKTAYLAELKVSGTPPSNGGACADFPAFSRILHPRKFRERLSR